MTPNSSSNAGSPVSLGDNSASVDIVNQARGRSDGFEVGGDRAIQNPPNWNYQDSNQLYQGAVNNNDPATAEATGQAWTHHGSELSQASNDLYNAISELGAVWVGEGAAAAQGALVGIANSGSQASEAAHTMATRLAQQAAAAAEVKKMPAPKNYDPASAMSAALAGGPAAMVADQKAQADAAADVKAQQVAFFNAYTKSMSEVDSSTPSFGPDSLGMKPTAGHTNGSTYSSVGGVGSGAGGMGAVTPGGLSSVSSASSVNGPDGSSAHSAASAGYVPGNGQTGASAFTAAPAPAAGSGLGVGAGAGAGAITPTVSTGGSAGGGGLGQALGLGVVGGGLGAVGGRVLGQGNRSGSKQNDDDTTASASNDNSAQSAASVAAPQQGVVSASGTIGGNSAPPMGGMGGMGGGAHQMEEDETHTHASFLIEPDPDDAFGANEATPPPVIGAWSEDDDR